ncbi:hypothetical protein H0E87_024603 [Populus deltoides]|uniref:Protein kinase domain-containing protein n=1 Tax=Populus deltoides TaxID=3696 RepID=A0A8T2X8D3_POPDE|nr:hypothetical protein H0E87_024603 [Populus deltoides]
MDWTRGHTIGRGSTATVSVATSIQSGDVFAVKSVELSQSGFLQREQKILSSIISPFIVSYKGCDVTRKNNKVMYNLFLEYMPNGSLSNAIHAHDGGRLDESLIRIFTYQILQGLDYLHLNGLVHCDIKSSNILVAQSGAKIADFGMMCIQSSFMQVLVYHDLLGMMQHPHHAKVTPKFCKQYAHVGDVINKALVEYKEEVANGSFPGPAHSPYKINETEINGFMSELQKLGLDKAAASTAAAAEKIKMSVSSNGPAND